MYDVIVLSQHLCERGSGEVVKRWVNEVQEAMASDNMMVQYHAMGVLYHIRKRDKYVPCFRGSRCIAISVHCALQAGRVEDGVQADQVLSEVAPWLLSAGELVPVCLPRD